MALSSLTSDSAKQARLKRWSKMLTQFLSGQACIQAVNLITGLVLLRWLSVRDYAQFSVAFAFQSTLNSLVDLGFSGSIIALVGNRTSDSGIIGSYIKTAKTLRGRFSVLGIAASCFIFPFLTLRQGWSIPTIFILLGAIIAGILFQSRMIYAAPLLISGRLKPYYRSQILAAIIRLCVCFLLYAVGILTAASAACVAALTTAINGYLYRQSAAPLINEPSSSAHEHNREMLRYLAPLMPGVIFTALQGQVIIMLIAWFGKTANIAEVAALGRLGQLFLVLGAFNAVIVEPYIASVNEQHLARRYLQILAGALFLAGILSLTSFLFPAPLLWLLGPKYHNLGAEIGWSIAAACMGYVGGVMWTMHSARKWLFWWSTFLYIAVLVSVDALCILYMDLSTTMSVLHFSFITSAGALFVHIVTAFYGFKVKKKTVSAEQNQLSVHA